MKKIYKYKDTALLIMAVFFVFSILINSISIPRKVVVRGTATKSFLPLADASIDSIDINGNHGAATSLTTAYYQNTGSIRKTFIKFDTSSIPQNATVTSAKLKLFPITCDGENSEAPYTLRLSSVRTPWSESTVTWATQPGYSAGATAQAALCGRVWELDAKDIVQRWVSGSTNYGLAIDGKNDSSWTRAFYSREGGQASAQPKLTVVYSVPDAGNSSSGSSNNLPPAPGIAAAPPPSSSTNQTQAPIDDYIPVPVFMSIFRSGEQLDLAQGGEFEVDTSDTVTLVGAGQPGYKIVAFVEGESFETTVNTQGYWAISFKADKFKENTYEINVQQQNESKGSRLEMFAKMNVIDFKATVKELSKGTNGMDWFDRFGVIMFYLGPILSLLFWIFVITLIIVLIVRHNKKKAKESSSNLQTQETNQSVKVPETTEVSKTSETETALPASVVKKPDKTTKKKEDINVKKKNK